MLHCRTVDGGALTEFTETPLKAFHGDAPKGAHYIWCSMRDAVVLVVDDNPETLNLFAAGLEAEGFQVRTASSVLRALEALHDGTPRPAIIVTDLMMPRTSGWDFLKHLRAEEGLQSLPIIVITGVEPGDSEQLANVVLQKPVDTMQLAEAVRALIPA